MTRREYRIVTQASGKTRKDRKGKGERKKKIEVKHR
jgi:hypothetical protein